MRTIFQTSQFKKDLKRLTKRGKDIAKLKSLVTLIAQDLPLEDRYKDHPLVGNWLGSHDCHIEPDWLLIYRLSENELFLERTGSHADLFR